MLNALVTEHTGLYEADNLCRLISVVGTTTEYYRQFRDNYIDRVTTQITLKDGILGDEPDDLLQFVARYLNAMSLEPDVLDNGGVMVLKLKIFLFTRMRMLSFGVHTDFLIHRF